MTIAGNESTAETKRTAGIDRRDILKMVGGSAIGVATMTGSASARPHTFQFFGCSQVCSETADNFAIVNTGSGFACRAMDETSNRNNTCLPGEGTVYCYEVADGEAIVGVFEVDYEGDGDVDCSICFNPNSCASNYIPESPCETIREQIGTCGVDCDIFHCASDQHCDVCG